LIKEQILIKFLIKSRKLKIFLMF